MFLVPVKELEYKLYHRNFKKHWELPDNFPDKRVIEAYEKPLVIIKYNMVSEQNRLIYQKKSLLGENLILPT